MSDTFVISDPHFGHQRILTFTDEKGELFRKFSSVEEMNETIIDNWNKTVNKGDTVYVLGDMTWDREWFITNWPRLNGKKKLTPGNHDDIKWLSKGNFFKDINLWYYFRDLEVVLTHVPIALWREPHVKYKYNIHGHTHANDVIFNDYTRDTRYFNACVEKINYTPVHLEEAVAKLKKDSK
jgi:calcineurin-like phosphoesterase family protein